MKNYIFEKAPESSVKATCIYYASDTRLTELTFSKNYPIWNYAPKLCTDITVVFYDSSEKRLNEILATYSRKIVFDDRNIIENLSVKQIIKFKLLFCLFPNKAIAKYSKMLFTDAEIDNICQYYQSPNPRMELDWYSAILHPENWKRVFINPKLFNKDGFEPIAYIY